MPGERVEVMLHSVCVRDRERERERERETKRQRDN